MRRAVLAAVLSVSALTAAAVDIRSLDRAFDYEAIVHLGVPDSATVEERARYAVALARVGRASESAKFADQLVKEHPDDRWSWYAVGAGGARGDVRLAASEKMLSLPGELADEMILARENMLARSSHFAELHEWLRTLPESPAKALAQAEGLVIEANIEEKKALNREALKILKAARRRWPSDLRLALAEAESLLDVDHRAEARALVGSAAKRTPALKVHRLLWTAAFVPGVSDAAARGVVHRDLEQLLARRGDWPEVEVASAIEYIYLHEPAKADALFERAQREQRASYAGEQALWWRYFGPQMDERNGPWSKAAATRDEERLRAYLAYSYHSSVFNTAKGAVELFRLISRDEHPDREELKSVIETMQPMVRSQPEIDSEGARAMAEFGLDLEEAEKLARHALEAVSAQKSSPATLAVAHDALGWVLFKRGDLTGAEKELAAAREADPFNFDVNVHLGRVAEEQKRFDEAARDYFAASRTPTRWENRAGDDLRRVFAASHDG